MHSALLSGCLLVIGGWQGHADEVFARGANGTWRTIAVERRNGTLTVRISPEHTEAGRALLLLAKPDWMTLEDTTPPTARSVVVDGARAEVGERLEIEAADAGPQLKVVFGDEANPLRLDALRLALAGKAFEALDVSGGPPERTATATFDLSALGPGAYDGFLEARDMAPDGNLLRLGVRVVIDGVRRHEDGQTVTICRAGHEYVVGGEGQGQAFARLGSTGAAAYLSTEVNGRFVYARRIVRHEDLAEDRGVRLVADVIGIEDQDFGQIAELEFDVTTRPDFPGVLLTSRSRNLDADGDVYCFWGWLPGSSYVTRDGERAWGMKYEDIGTVGWVFLPPSKPGQPGIGVISPLLFGESRFGTLLIYTDPRRIHTARGEAVEMRLAFMLADEPKAVAEACETLAAAGWLPGE